jgi:hypothetical protein
VLTFHAKHNNFMEMKFHRIIISLHVEVLIYGKAGRYANGKFHGQSVTLSFFQGKNAFKIFFSQIKIL